MGSRSAVNAQDRAYLSRESMHPRGAHSVTVGYICGNFVSHLCQGAFPEARTPNTGGRSQFSD